MNELSLTFEQSEGRSRKGGGWCGEIEGAERRAENAFTYHWCGTVS